MFSIVTATMNLRLEQADKVLAFYDECRDAGFDFELIVQDNGSDVDVIRIFQSRDYVNLVSGADNGIYDAWNRALKRVSGDWVAFQGIDDLPTLDWVAFVSEFASTSEVSALACDVSIEDEAHHRLGVFKNPRSGYLHTESNKFAHPGLAVAQCTFITRRFPEEYRIIGDLVFYSQLNKIPVLGHIGTVGVSMQLGGISNSPTGARRVLQEYLTATFKRDVPLHLPLLIKRILAAALSVVPQWYNSAQKRRWKREGR